MQHLLFQFGFWMNLILCFVLKKKNHCDKNGQNVNGQFYKNSFGSELPLLCTLQQSLDYDTAENTLYFKEQKSYSAEVRTDSVV